MLLRCRLGWRGVLAAGVLLGGCRRVDVREMEVAVPGFPVERRMGVEQVLNRTPGVVPDAFCWSDRQPVLTLKYDSLRTSEMNIRHVLAAKGIPLAEAQAPAVPDASDVPPATSPRHVYLKNRGLEDLKGDACRAALSAGTGIDYLNLDYNRLTDVSEVVGLTGLKWLRLNGNRLTSLPDLTPLTKLRRLYLRDNRLTSIPECLDALPQLTDLDVSGNPISEVPAWLARRRGLENLSFNGTRITRLPEDLSAWKTLKSLQLGDLNLPAEEMKRIRAALCSPNSPGRTVVVF